MNKILSNFIDVYSKWYNILIFLLSIAIVSTIFIHFTDGPLIKGNFGVTYYWSIMISQFLITFLFSFFIPIATYKYFKFASFSVKESAGSGLGAFIGLIVAGCPACSITLASYLGLAGIVSLLPWYGLELKLIAIPILIYSNYSLLNTLNECKVK